MTFAVGDIVERLGVGSVYYGPSGRGTVTALNEKLGFVHVDFHDEEVSLALPPCELRLVSAPELLADLDRLPDAPG